MKTGRFFPLMLKYFLQGLLLISPIAITIFVIYRGFEYLDGLFPFRFPGLGILVVLIGITLIGFLGSTIIAQPFKVVIGDIISKTPVIKYLYSSVKEFVEALVGNKKKFNEPVLVKIEESTGLLRLGFITKKDLSILGLGEEYVAVYFPHSYAFSGNLVFTQLKNITPVKGSPAHLMKFVITAGVTSLQDDKEDPEKDFTELID